jgi:hypothetical protein
MGFGFSYLVYSLIFLSIWGALFFLRQDIRRKMLLFSLTVTPMGPISEIWFLRDYWHRPTITGYPISIEDFLFAFAIGGITFSIYQIIFNMTIDPSPTYTAQKWLIIGFPIVVLLFLLVLTNIFKINSIFSSSLAFIVLTLIIWFLRPDLVKPSMFSGLLTLSVFLLVYQIMQLIFPSVLLDWCKDCNPSGLRILGVNVEELWWDFSWGLVGSVIYAAIRGRKFTMRGNRKKYPIPSSFSEFNGIYDEEYSVSLHSKYGTFMATSSKNVFSIRLVRQLTFLFSKATNRIIPQTWIMFLLSLFPTLVNLLLWPFRSSCGETTSLWILYSSILNYCLLAFPQIAWSRLIKMSDLIDDMLGVEEQQRDDYISWMKRRLNLPFQAVLSVIGGVIGVAAVILLTPVLSKIMDICFPLYVSVFITGGLGINAVYWLWGVPLQIRRLSQFKRLRVTWNNPAGTPGIREQSQLLGFSAILSAIGVVLFITPLLWAYFSAQPDTLFAAAINTIAFMASIGTVIFVAVSPQYWLSKIVYREKNLILDQLSSEISALYTNTKVDEERKWQILGTKINIYQAINATSVFTRV